MPLVHTQIKQQHSSKIVHIAYRSNEQKATVLMFLFILLPGKSICREYDAYMYSINNCIDSKRSKTKKKWEIVQ